jgi:predicted 3-demethylubiquinone-9 3-methyltransferase (glyoxalase superfamily)
MPTLTTCLWFDDEALDAARFYVSVFPDSEVTDVTRLGPDGNVLTVNCSLSGAPFKAIKGGPRIPHSEAFSVFLSCADQTEADHYWGVLVSGGRPSQCGWLVDRFGISWQVVPEGLGELLHDPDPARAAAAQAAMLTMSQLDLGAIRAAAESAGASAEDRCARDRRRRRRLCGRRCPERPMIGSFSRVSGIDGLR